MTLQEQLCEYAAKHAHDMAVAGEISLWDYSRPWTYVYREDVDHERAPWRKDGKCAECIGVVMELEDGRKIGWSVAAMLADAAGHARVLRSAGPGPKYRPRAKSA